LTDAGYNAKKNDRKEILAEDVEEAIEMNKKLLKDRDKKTSPEEMFTNALAETQRSPKKIKLKKVFDYADKIKASFIDAKIKSEM